MHHMGSGGNFGLLKKYEIATRANMMHHRKKFGKPKSLEFLSYNWSVSKFLTSDQNLVH